MSVLESCEGKETFSEGGGMLHPSRLFIYDLITRFIPETRGFTLKVAFLRWCGASVGHGVRICSSARFMGVGELEIGDETWVGHGVFINSGASVQIGARVDIAPFVFIGTGTHEVDRVGPRVAGKGCHRSVVAKDGCWLGARSMLLPGIVVGEKAIVAAGAVVTQDVPDGCLVAGVPAVIKSKVVGS